MQAIVGVAFAASMVLAVFDVADFWGAQDWWWLIVFFLLGYTGVALGCIARGAQTGAAGIARSLVVVPIYAAYAWLIWPVLAAAATRQLTGRRGWSKTRREPIGDYAAKSAPKV